MQEYKTKNMRKNASKGNLALLQSGVLALVIVGILLAIGLQILDQTQGAIGDAGSTNSAAYNATGQVVTAVGSFGDWMSIIVVVIAGAVIFGLLAMLSGGARRRI